jgi:tetraacyldisaccharide 4'-kinase
VEQSGDEAAMLALQLPDAIVVVAERRSKAAEIAMAEFGADVLVMDDGFQHRSLRRELNILVVDGRSDLLREPVLPAGLRREPLSGIARAELIAVSKVDSPDAVREMGERLARWTAAPVFGFRLLADGIVDLLTGEPVARDKIERVTVMSGIGDPKGFATTVRGTGMDVVAKVDFGDHHHFTPGELASVLSTAALSKSQCVITTEKDAVRLCRDELRKVLRDHRMPVAVLRTRLEVIVGENHLEGALVKILAGGTKRC